MTILLPYASYLGPLAIGYISGKVTYHAARKICPCIPEIAAKCIGALGSTFAVSAWLGRSLFLSRENPTPGVSLLGAGAGVFTGHVVQESLPVDGLTRRVLGVAGTALGSFANFFVKNGTSILFSNIDNLSLTVALLIGVGIVSSTVLSAFGMRSLIQKISKTLTPQKKLTIQN